jgi:hypothetical protein
MPEGAFVELTPSIVVIEESSQYLHAVFACSVAMRLCCLSRM